MTRWFGEFRTSQKILVLAGFLLVTWLPPRRVVQVLVLVGALLVLRWIVRQLRDLLHASIRGPHRPRFFVEVGGDTQEGCTGRRSHWADCDGPFCIGRARKPRGRG